MKTSLVRPYSLLIINKTDTLFSHLGEALNSHYLTTPKYRIEMIKTIFLSLQESEWRDIFNLVKKRYNVDLNYFDTGVNTAQPQNSFQKMNLHCLSPLIIENIYMDLDLK